MKKVRKSSFRWPEQACLKRVRVSCVFSFLPHELSQNFFTFSVAARPFRRVWPLLSKH